MSYSRTTPGYLPPRLPRWASAALISLLALEVGELVLGLL